jgi:putative zinc finger protein
MKHFSDEAWIDFARGTTSPRKAAELKRHLDECSKCRSISGLWNAVLEILRREQEYRPSDHAIRSAKGMYDLHRALQSLSGEKADLIFDSFQTPLLAGVRNSQMPSQRQLQYEFGPMLIDIELSEEFGESETPILLSGQISTRDESQSVNDCRVFLIRGKRFIAQTKCSRLGEFHFDFADGMNCKLLIDLDNREVIQLLLPDMTS